MKIKFDGYSNMNYRNDEYEGTTLRYEAGVITLDDKVIAIQVDPHHFKTVNTEHKFVDFEAFWIVG